MKRDPVESSAIVSIGYERASHTLEVEFSSRTVYQYHDVEAKTYREFIKAPSKGRFFDMHIRDEYACSRIR